MVNFPFKISISSKDIENFTLGFPEAQGKIPEKNGNDLDWKQGMVTNTTESLDNPVSIFEKDVKCLQPRKYLNDALINFWMKWYVALFNVL